MQTAMEKEEQGAFRSALKDVRYYLEFGCGGSTVIALEAGIVRGVSVESDADWIKKLRGVDSIGRAEREGALIFHHVDIGPVGAWGVPTDSSAIQRWYQYYTRPFFDYDLSFDFVFLDGRFRVNCAITAAIFAPESARVVFHDYDRRDWYFVAEKYFDILSATGSLYVLRRKKIINYRSAFLDLLSNQFDYR